jgi:glycerophosphoryl diester phosphodiesterase
MLIIAHRGANREAQENSFEAFDLAVECGAQRIELDVQFTKDKIAVINHDDDLFHSVGNHFRCSQLCYEELKKLRLKNGQSIPSLQEVVDQYIDRIELNIEIKGGSYEAGALVAGLIKNEPKRDKLIVSCFKSGPLLAMREVAPWIQRACLVGDDEVYWDSIGEMSTLNFMGEVSAQIIHPRVGQVTQGFMDQCRHRKWKVFSWSTMIGEDYDREHQWSVLSALGVDGHCTNFPRELVGWLNNEIMERDLIVDASKQFKSISL